MIICFITLNVTIIIFFFYSRPCCEGFFDQYSLYHKNSNQQGILFSQEKFMDHILVIHIATPEFMIWCFDEFAKNRRAKRLTFIEI